MPIFGWDASDFDWDRGPMDVAAAARDGIVFFTHKATEGTRVKHVRYREAMSRAVAAGIPLMGAYVVPRTPGNNGHGSIQAQVSYFLSYLDSQTPWWRDRREFFLQVDLEHWGYDDVAPQHGVEMCRLLRAVTGKWVVLYAPRWAYGNSIGGSDPLWASAYGNNPAKPYRQAYRGDSDAGWNPYSGRTPLILQYGSATTIGSQVSCDINAFRGTLDQLRAIVTGGRMTTDYSPSTARAIAVGATEYGFIQATDPKWDDEVGTYNLKAVEGRLVDAINDVRAKVDSVQAGGAPTQEQVDAAMHKAMLDPAVQKGIGDALAAHLHVS